MVGATTGQGAGIRCDPPGPMPSAGLGNFFRLPCRAQTWGPCQLPHTSAPTIQPETGETWSPGGESANLTWAVCAVPLCVLALPGRLRRRSRFPRVRSPGVYVCSDKKLGMFGCSPSPSEYTYPNKWLHVTLGKDWETLPCSCYDAVGFFLLATQPLLRPSSSGPENCQGNVPFYWDSCPQPLDQPS